MATDPNVLAVFAFALAHIIFFRWPGLCAMQKPTYRCVPRVLYTFFIDRGTYSFVVSTTLCTFAGMKKKNHEKTKPAW